MVFDHLLMVTSTLVRGSGFDCSTQLKKHSQFLSFLGVFHDLFVSLYEVKKNFILLICPFARVENSVCIRTFSVSSYDFLLHFDR